MRRCAECRSPNPDPAAHCMACGAALRPEQKLSWRQALAPASAARAALACLPLLMAYSLPFGRVFYPPHQDLRQAFFFAFCGLGLGLALAWMRQGRGLAFWLLAGLLGGLLAFACNWLYLYQHIIIRGVFWLVEWMDPADSIAAPFRALQVLRALALGLPLLLLRPVLEGAWWRLAPELLALALSAWARSRVLGPALGGPGSQAHLAWMALSLFLLLYALGRPAKQGDSA